MNIIAISDIHGCTDYLPAVSEQIEQADIVLIAGDITNFAGRAKARKILGQICCYNSHIFAVAGNCDLPAVDRYLTERNWNLSGNFVSLNGIGFAGLAGCKPYSGLLTHKTDEQRFENSLLTVAANITAGPFVLLTHHPAFGTKVDEVSAARHGGSRAVRDFIERYGPVLAVSGHIHEAAAVDRLGTTTLVNPGPFGHGSYACIELQQDTVKASIRHV